MHGCPAGAAAALGDPPCPRQQQQCTPSPPPNTHTHTHNRRHAFSNCRRSESWAGHPVRDDARGELTKALHCVSGCRLSCQRVRALACHDGSGMQPRHAAMRAAGRRRRSRARAARRRRMGGHATASRTPSSVPRRCLAMHKPMAVPMCSVPPVDRGGPQGWMMGDGRRAGGCRGKRRRPARSRQKRLGGLPAGMAGLHKQECTAAAAPRRGMPASGARRPAWRG